MDAPIFRFHPFEPDLGRLPSLSRAEVAGISVAIAGNVLISLALNCQKLAHRRLEREREQGHQLDQRPYNDLTAAGQRIDEEDEADEAAEDPNTVEGDEARVLDPGTPRDGDNKGQETPEDPTGNESDYLKSKLWWLGFLLMNVGEMGNFISYAFAPASIVAPLGTFALIANCVFAPFMLKERFRTRDFFGIIIAIIGAVTVVLSANASDTRLNHEGLIRAICQRPFLVYSIVYIVGAVILSGLSESEVGKKYVFVDVGLCALFGGSYLLSASA
ncbi:hypothetical protein EIP86_011355 [Pleurotus ostreatoroseus]|nr:hypothetical protein EIP86_011355 [Pleurotus ostreatoroseus]